MSTVLLISETTLKKYTVINDNVDACYITPSIVSAQDIGLQPLIGSVLYAKLCNLVMQAQQQQGTGIDDPANEDYKVLLDEYVTKYLCHKVTAELHWALLAKLRNNGIVTSADQQTQQMSMENCELLRKHYDQQAIFYGKRMTDYLCANADKYPEWKQRNTVADIKADSEAYNTGIVL